MKYVRIAILFSSALILSSCLDSEFGTEEKRLSLYFLVNNIGTELEYDDNTLIIEEFKFPLERLNLYAANDVVLETRSEVTALIFAFRQEFNRENLIIDIGIGFSDIVEFQNYEMFLQPLNTRGSILDNDFFGPDENYSVIIKGTLNEIEFTMKSTGSINKIFDLGPVRLSESKETLVINKSIDLKSVFIGEDALFLDPTDPVNETAILDNIKSFLEVNASAGSTF